MASPLYRRQLSQEPSDLVKDAPSSKDLAGVHLLLDNDVDSNTPKRPIIFLSRPRIYDASQHICERLGENSKAIGFVKDLLDTTPVAADELENVKQLWVRNADDKESSSNACTAFDRRTGKLMQLSCSTHLPVLCTNSLPRTLVGIENEKSKQIKVSTPKAGTWQGYRDQNQFRFLGISYAQPPIGRRRFMPPQRIIVSSRNRDDVDAVQDATKFGFVCMQGAQMGDEPVNKTEEILNLGAPQSEDCLHLNVFTPSLTGNKRRKKGGLPVMVYVHGGGFTSFSGSSPPFEPGNLVSRGGVVVVTLNYRLGIFGFFENVPSIPRSRATGNLEIRDQIAALQWVQENIATFGGDPDQVTIFGESAGGYSMRALLSAPSAWGLYKNVISQSDLLGEPFTSPKMASGPGGIGSRLMDFLGCEPSDLVCAQTKTVDEIQAAEQNATMAVAMQPGNEWVNFAAIYRPTIDGHFLPGDFAELIRSGRFNRKANIMWGSTRDEMAAFIPLAFPDPIPVDEKDKYLPMYLTTNRTRRLIESPFYSLDRSDPDTVRNELSRAVTDLLWACPIQRISRGVAAQRSNKVYTYQFNHGREIYSTFGGVYPPFCKGRICHTDDILPSFGSGDVVVGSVQTGGDARFARQVIDRFTTFAKTGNPNPNPDSRKNSAPLGLANRNQDVTGVHWPAYEASSDKVFAFEAEESRVVVGADTERCRWIEKNVRYDYQVHGPSGKFVPLFP
ncbi:hypothetical protein BGX33_011273 [Mortierella sp. NVP41]|nr:hypothetical protein BGX33_011273 [Mortierella sp. NVP41]